MAIEKIRLKNFRNFQKEEIVFNRNRNILIGENGVGKSSILAAISHVISGSFSSIEKVGFQALFNVHAIQDFLKSDRDISHLPVLFVELYLSDETEKDTFELNGKVNSERIEKSGLRMSISPNEIYLKEIEEVLKEGETFPFEYYRLEFKTFAGYSYSSYGKKHRFRYDLLDTSLINTQYTMKKYVSRLLNSQTDADKRRKINLEFRKQAEKFSESLYVDSEIKLDDSLEYRIVVEAIGEQSFLEKITAQKDSIDISDLGQGEKVMLSAELAFTGAETENDIVLIEEPENHLSYLNMHKLIGNIESTSVLQSFVTTHSNMVASRLDLQNVILLGKGKSTKLNQLDPETSYFFQKAPDTNILDFVLSNSAILVEGDAEYILMKKFYEMITDFSPEEMGVAIISCDGKTFKRYLEVAMLLNKKVAVITDNDSDYENNVVNNYSEYEGIEDIGIFSETNNELKTLEYALYHCNIEFLENNIESTNMSKGVLHFMLKNKAEAAFRLLKVLNDGEKRKEFIIPDYIKEAIKWIKK